MSSRQTRSLNRDRLRATKNITLNRPANNSDQDAMQRPPSDLGDDISQHMQDDTTSYKQTRTFPTSPPSSPEHASDIPTFSLTPYSVNREVLNLSSTEGRKVYDRAILPLDDDKFDCQSDQLRLFLNNLARRALIFGWDDPQDGVLMLHIQNTTINILRSYGEVTLEEIRESETFHIQTPTRRAQDSVMLFHCLMNSISKEAKTNLTIWESEYMINNIPSGALLLKIIIRESHIDTNATSSAIRLRLSNLDVYINTINDDIPKFNIYVREQITSLAARGQASDDLLTNLFKGYLAVSDRTFHRYIQEKQERYEEGSADITVNQLMHLAKTKYSIIKEKGMWHAPTPEETKILALTAEVTKLKNKGKNNEQRPSNNNQKDRSRHRRYYSSNTPRWMYNQPSHNDLLKPKLWNSQEWYWCGKATQGHCERYRRHRGKECLGIVRPNTSQQPYPTKHRQHDKQQQQSKHKRHHKNSKRTYPSKQEPQQKKIRLSQALEAIHDTTMCNDDSFQYE